MRLIRRGEVCDEVAHIQDTLNLLMYPPANSEGVPGEPLKADKIFGPKTESRVKEFQALRRIKPDGIVGPITKWHLFPFVLYRGKATGCPRRELRLRGHEYPKKMVLAAHAGNVLGQVKPVPNVFPPVPPIGPTPKPAPGTGLSLPQVVSVELQAGQKLELAPLPPIGARDARIRSLVFEFSFTMVRTDHWEASVNLELSRKLPARANDTWQVDGSAKLGLRPLPLGTKRLTLSPSMEVIPHKLGAAGGLEICLEVDKLIDKKLEDSAIGVCVGGKGGFGIDPEADKIKFQTTGEVSGGVKVDVLRVIDLLF
jgi:hypothetical protein